MVLGVNLCPAGCHCYMLATFLSHKACRHVLLLVLLALCQLRSNANGPLVSCCIHRW